MTLTHDDPVTEPARFRPRGQDDLAPSGTASRIAANLAALRLLRLLEREDRPATPDEQAVLARWSGWGAVPQVFDDDHAEFAAARADLHQLLSEAEYAAARRTTINAHYTDAALAKVVWDHVTALGSGTGKVLEPGCGSGNFIGLAPPGAQVLGVELDPVTAAITARLYPDAEIRCESFADTRLPEGHFDLAIGNVPFSAARLHDRRYNAAGHSMHNHFIIKSLKFLKPGGLLAVLTSRYTMDAQDPAAREEMAGLASLVTAVRLPSGAHRRAAGTEAVTDLLILRRADPGTPGGRPQWRRAFETSLDGGTAWINEYWRDHPENVLGSFTVGQGQYNDHDLTVRPSGDLSGVASQLAVRLAARPVTVVTQEVPAGEADRFDGTLRANDDGSFSVLRDGLWQDWPCPATQAGELRDLLGLRDTVAALLDAEASSPDDTPAIAGLRAELNRRYDAYTAAYGPVNRTGWKRTGKTDDEGNDVLARNRPPQGKFSEDPYAAAVYALEDFDPETGQAAKTVIFTQRVVTTRQAQESASDPADAVAICMDQAGEVRIEDAARLLGSVSADEARTTLGELVYDEPGTGRLVPAAEYLSGKVRAKLREAGQAAEEDPRFDVNVAALRRALPDDLGPGEIDARLGASWIDWRYVQQGLREILEDPRLKVEKGHGTSWTVTGDKTSVLATQVWGTEDKDAVTLAACLLEQRPVKVSPERSERDDTPRDKHQKRLAAAAATVTARAKADELNRRFGEWLWESPARTADLVKTYNERFNSVVLRSYDGARPALPGLAAWFREWVHPHQLAAVARIINEPAVLLAHDVGAGKTAEMGMGAMELRRLGLAAKPAIVVPNHMLEQFQREFLQLYPQARVLAAGNDDLKALGRHKFVARIATGNWDAVIMSQSVFERIPISAPEIERYIAAQLAGYDAWLERAREASQSKRMIKKMETRKLMREQRLRKKLDRARDGGISWEQTGIDYLFVDEAHHYKNLDIRSNNQELDIDGSGRASDLEMKLDYLRTTHGRRVVTFATATPIANSMTEAYVMCRYLRPDLLADAGIEDFDAWVGTFAATTTDVEVAPEGGIRVKDRFARFRNIPELLNMWRVAADVKTKEDLKLPVPELAGGKPEVVPVEPPEQLLEFMQNLARRAEAVRSRAVLPDEDNMLKISNDGRLAALDPRLAGLRAPETGKLDVAAQNIARIEHEYRGHRYYDGDGNLLPVIGSLQIVFCDLGTPGGKSRWNAYEYLRDKLAEFGTDPRMVRFMHEAKSDKAKAELFAAARAGKVAVLVGSTSLMGVGTNVQDLAVALHHLDCPWRPADVAQREGRILRQRNKHPRVHIYRYVTERSFDAYMWQTVTRKAKFIDQVIHGKTTSRDAEDIGGDMAALSYSEVTALATGDMRILAKAKADSDVRRLEDLESAWQRSRLHLKTKISDSQKSVARLTDVTAQLDSAIERRVDTRGDAFTIRLDGQAFSKRTDAAACLRSLLYTQISQAKKGTRPRDDPGHIGTLGGFTIISAPTWGAGNQVWAHLRFDGVPVPAVRISETELGLTPDKPPVGLITRLENKLADLGADRDKAAEEISRIQAETERARTAIAAPFTHADELARARTQSDRLAEELSGQPSAADDLSTRADNPGSARAGQAPEPDTQTPAAGTATAEHVPPRTEPQSAPADAVSSEDDAVAPEAASAPPGHDPGRPADPDQPTTSDPAGETAAGLVIEHHQQSTLVHGTQKSDHQLRRMLRNHGFRWSGNLNAWFLPRPWTFSTRSGRVSSLTADLRQSHRSFTMRTQQPAPAGTDDSPPEPLPAAEPYTDLRQARRDHSEAVSDYWALTRTPAGNNVMSAYSGSGARPDAVTLNTAYQAVRVSWDEAFAGDPQEVTDRFTAWVQAAAALSRNLAAEQHRAPRFRQILDTFISSATRLASRTQATAEDPATWARVFADVPGNAPASGPPPEAKPPAPGASPGETGHQGQDSGGDDHAAGPATAPGVSAGAEDDLPVACRNADDLRRLAAAHMLSSATEPGAARGSEITVVYDHGRTVLLHDAARGTMAGGYRLTPGEVPAYLAAYLRYPQLPPRCLAGLAREDPAVPGTLTLADARETAARHGLEVRVRRVTGQSHITFCEPGVTGLPVLSYPAGARNAFHGPSAVPVAVIGSYLFTYRRSVPAVMFAPPAAAPPDWARRVTQLTPHMVEEGGYFIRGARDHLTAALAAARDGNAEDAARLLSQAESATPPLTPSPERDAELTAVITRHAARYGHTEDPAGYMARAVPALLDASDREWEWVRSYISAHPEVREHRAQDEPAAQAAGPDESDEPGAVTVTSGEPAATAGETAPVTGPEQHRAAGPPEGTQPLAAHTGWAGDLRPERLLYADGTPLAIRGQGDDNNQVLPATAAGAVPAPADSDYGPGRLQVVRWDDGQYAVIHPALASPAGIDAYAGLGDRDRARWEAFDLAEAWPTATAGLSPRLVDVGDYLEVERGPRNRTTDRREVQWMRPGRGALADGLEFKVAGVMSFLFYPPNSLVPVCIPSEHPSLPTAINAALASASDQAATEDPDPDLPARTASDDTVTPDTARVTTRPGQAAPALLTNGDLAAELRRLPGFARWLSLTGTLPAAGDLDAQRPGAGSSAACDARGIEITVSGPDFTRHGLVTWPQAASWIDKGVTPARLGLVIIADRLSTFCRTHRDQLIAAGASDPDAAAAELAQIRNTAVAMIVDAALRSRGAAKPVPPAGPDDPAWYTTVMITRPDRTASKAENAALERLTRLRTAIREPQPTTAAEIRGTIRRWTRHGGLPGLVRGLDNPAAIRAWISEQASSRGQGQYDGSGERWYGSSPDGLITDRNGDDRAPVLIQWEEIPAWIQPGITSSQRDQLLAADDTATANARRRLTAADHPGAGLTAPGEEEDKQAGERLTEAADAVWAAIEAAPPPSPVDVENARRIYRDTGPVQPALFDDPQQDNTPAQDTTRATASRQPRPALPRPATPVGARRPAATASAPPAEDGPRQDPPARPGTGTRHTPSAGPAGQRQPGADRPGRDTAAKYQAAKPADAAPTRAPGTPEQNPATAAAPAPTGPAYDDDPEPPQTPATNSDLAIALHSMSDQELTSFLNQGKTPDGHGSLTSRPTGLPDSGASQMLRFDHGGVRITVSSRRFRRHGQISWRQVASWLDTGLTSARLGIITGASQLGTFTHARRDQLIADGKDNIDAAITELRQISSDAIDAALTAALAARDADAPVPPASRGKPTYLTTAMLTRPDRDPAATADENTALTRIAELESAIRGTQPCTPADIKSTIRWWIGDDLPEYARALASPESMRAWINRQASGPASRPGEGSYDSALDRYYSASPEGLRTHKGSDTRVTPYISWEEISAWIQPGLPASLRDRLAAAEPSPAPGRTSTAAARPPADAADPASQADDPLPQPLREALDAAWAAIEAAPPPSIADLDHARTLYRGTGTAQQPQPGGPAKAGKPGPSVRPAPRPRTEPSPALPPRHTGPATDRQDGLPAAASSSAGPPPRHDKPARAATSSRTKPGPAPEPTALPQPATTPAPLTDDDVFLGIGRLPAFVIGDLFHAIDTGQPVGSVSRQLAPYSGERAAGEPDPGAQVTVTPEPAGLRIQVNPEGSRRTGLITWQQVDGLLRPGTTPARRQIVTQAWRVRIGFMAANASFRAAGEGHLAAAAEDELHAQAAAAVTAILAAAHPAVGGQASQAADEDATVERIADLAAALPSEPRQPRTPAGQVTTGDVIGHPGYRFQPFRVTAPPRHTDAAVEITGRLTEPAGTEPAGPITLTLPRTGQPGPFVSVIPAPARSLRPLFPGHDAAPDTSQPADARPDRALAETPGSPSDAVPVPDTETPEPDTQTPASQPDDQDRTQEETMPAADSTAASGSLTSPEPGTGRLIPVATTASAPSETAGQRNADRSSRGSHAADRPEDGASVTDQLEPVLDAIRERRGATANGHASDDFSDIRRAFAAMRDALGLSAAGPEAEPGQPAPTPAPAQAAAASRPPRGEPRPAADDFTDIQATFADLRDVLGLPAHGRHARSDAPTSGTDVSVAAALDQAAAEAQACARWYRDTPEWQRINTVGRAARDLITAIREAASDYWAEIRLDIRVRGFARTLAARTALAVSGAAHVLAGRLERAGHRNTRTWRAAWRLHQATATFANRVMRYTPPGSPDRMREARRIIADLGRHHPEPPGPGRHAASHGTGGTGTPNAAALASASFPVMVTRANARQAAAAPAARTVGSALQQHAAKRQ